MSQYSLAKRVVQQILGLREFGARTFTLLPDQVSPIVYRWMRQTLFRDNSNREQVFAAAIRYLKSAGARQFTYLEFGVARGTSLIMAHDLSQSFGYQNIRLIGFDSFAGLPGSEGGEFESGEMAYSEKEFLRFATKAGIPRELITTVKGLYEDTLTERTRRELRLHPGSYLIHCDCDLYESTKLMVNFIEPIVQGPSALIFDDYFDFDYKADPENWGEKRAFREWDHGQKWREIARKEKWNIAFGLDKN